MRTYNIDKLEDKEYYLQETKSQRVMSVLVKGLRLLGGLTMIAALGLVGWVYL